MSRVGTATRWASRRWRQSLVFSLTVMGVCAVAVLGLITSAVVGGEIEHDAQSRAHATAESLARSTFAPRFPRPGQRLSPDANRTIATAQNLYGSGAATKVRAAFHARGIV